MKSFKSLKCDTCNCIVERVDINAIKVICWKCSTKMVTAPEIKSSNKSDKPRGWKFMKQYVHKDGTVYFKGIEQPELKGTLPVTDNIIKKEKKKLSKQEKVDLQSKLGIEIQNLKNAMLKEKRKTKKAEIQRSLQKLNRQLSKVK